MHLKYWVYTDGEGKAYINLVSNLRLATLPENDGTVIHSGTFLKKAAGSKINWDAGLCQLTYKEDTSKIQPPIINDYFYNEMNDWFNGKITVAQQAEQMHDCRYTMKDIDGIIKTRDCLDIN